jgi:serine/threonine protein kinase
MEDSILVVALNLLEEMLEPNPRYRICVADALAHEYLSLCHGPTDEPMAARYSDWPFNNTNNAVDI